MFWNHIVNPPPMCVATSKPISKNELRSRKSRFESRISPSERHGITATHALLAVIVALLTFLIVLVVLRPAPQSGGIAANNRAGETDSNSHGQPPKKEIKAGETVSREEVSLPQVVSKPAADPDRVREVVEVGKTYRSVLRAGIDSRTDTKAWGVSEVVSLAYEVEFVVNRTIEQNDGKRIVEIRHIEAARSVKLLCKVESITLNFGIPGELLLSIIAENIVPGSTAALQTGRDLAETILKGGADAIAKDHAAKAFARVESIQGKKVRVEFIDGQGVVSLTPIGCNLSPDDWSFFFNTASLTDYHVMPDLKLPVGSKWTIPGTEFAGLILDPTWKASPSGQVDVVRRADSKVRGKELATLAVESGRVDLDSSDATQRRIGRFEPRGTLRYSLQEQYVTSADLTGEITIEEVSKDHLLFETSFRSRPTLRVQYHCEKR